ncbi:MAG: hypothetical protein GY781_04230 [Gammaproteobacteria bacterium]|nr:hypothetical protein [Gammaproteobacteria bacterium]
MEINNKILSKLRKIWIVLLFIASYIIISGQEGACGFGVYQSPESVKFNLYIAGNGTATMSYMSDGVQVTDTCTIDSQCTHILYSGGEVSLVFDLHAYPDANMYFVGWSGYYCSLIVNPGRDDEESVPNPNPDITYEFPESWFWDENCTANFRDDVSSLELTIDGTGSGIVNGPEGSDISCSTAQSPCSFGSLTKDIPITLTATPEPGSMVSWSEGCGTVDTENPLEVTFTPAGADEEIQCTATFDLVAELEDLSLSTGTLWPDFDKDTLNYTAEVSYLHSSITLIPSWVLQTVAVSVNGVAIYGTGIKSEPISLNEGENTIEVEAYYDYGDTRASRIYTIVVDKQPAHSFAQQAYIKSSTNTPGGRLGTSVSLDGNTLAVGAKGYVGFKGQVHIFVRDDQGTWSHQAIIRPTVQWDDDGFGASVSLNGDTLAVGAPWESSNATGIGGNANNNDAYRSGAAYIFTRNNGVWSQQAYLKASDAESGDYFGESVRLDGNLVNGNFNLLAVTSSYKSSGTGAWAGAVYVFYHPATSWYQHSIVEVEMGDIGDRFGSSIALDNYTLVVGAQYEDSSTSGDQSDNSKTDAGAVYVFTINSQVISTNWIEQAFIKSSNADDDDRFGASVALSGDTLAASAFLEGSDATGVDGDESNNNADGAGAVYVFVRNSGNWSQQAYLKASNTNAGDWFGSSLSLDNDYLVVGAIYEDSKAVGINRDGLRNDGESSGAAYLFNRSNGFWTQQYYLKASNTDDNDRFGNSVAIDNNTLVVGAPEEDSQIHINGYEGHNHSENVGAAYIFASLYATSQTYLLSVNGDGLGAGTITGKRIGAAYNTINCINNTNDCNETLIDGEQFVLVATPDGNSSFTGWSNNGSSAGASACDGTEPEITITMEESLTCTASFVPTATAKRTLNVSISGTGTGSVVSSPFGINCSTDGGVCSNLFDEGTPVNLTAAPDSFSEFIGWSGDVECTSGDLITSVIMDKNIDCSVMFNSFQNTLKVSKAGNGDGVITGNLLNDNGNQTINCGTDCTEIVDYGDYFSLTATADGSSVFSGWSGTAECSDPIYANGNQLTIPVYSDITCTATFVVATVQRTITVTNSSNSNGTITDNNGYTCSYTGSVVSPVKPWQDGCNVHTFNTQDVVLEITSPMHEGWNGLGNNNCTVSGDQDKICTVNGTGDIEVIVNFAQ